MSECDLEDLDFEELVTLMGKQITEVELIKLVGLYCNTAREWHNPFKIIAVLEDSGIITKKSYEQQILNFSEIGSDRCYMVGGNISWIYIVNVEVNKITNLSYQDGSLIYQLR